MDLSDLEFLAMSALCEADMDDAVRTNPVRLATALLGAGCVERVESSRLPHGAALCRENNRWLIRVRRHLTSRQARWLILHEVAEYLLRRDGVACEQQEILANALAALLRAPRRAVLGAVQAGGGVAQVAAAFDSSHSSAALRIAEVTGEPCVLVAPRHVRARGEDFAWPDEQTIRQLTGSNLPGLRVLTVTDARRRWLITPDTSALEY